MQISVAKQDTVAVSILLSYFYTTDPTPAYQTSRLRLISKFSCLLLCCFKTRVSVPETGLCRKMQPEASEAACLQLSSVNLAGTDDIIASTFRAWGMFQTVLYS